MKIATLQIASKLGGVEANVRRADELLDQGIEGPDGGRIRVEDAELDMLVLSELALTGLFSLFFVYCSVLLDS